MHPARAGMAWVEAVLDTLGLQDEFRGVACVCVRPKNAVDQANGAMAIRSMARNALQQPKQWKTKVWQTTSTLAGCAKTFWKKPVTTGWITVSS